MSNLHNASKQFVTNLAENPHSLRATLVHKEGEEGCVICNAKTDLSMPSKHVHFLDRIATGKETIFIGSGVEEPSTITHEYNKVVWVEHPVNYPRYASKHLDRPLEEITYSLDDLFWVVNRGGYYAYDLVEEDSAKTELSRQISYVKKKIYFAQACYTTPDACLIFTEEELEAISLCAKGFSKKVNPDLAENVKPLLDKKALPVGSFPEM